eukprot:8661421-Pyramimonas_sp.AAC.1
MEINTPIGKVRRAGVSGGLHAAAPDGKFARSVARGLHIIEPPVRHLINNVTWSFYGSPCPINNGEDALNTPETLPGET